MSSNFRTTGTTLPLFMNMERSSVLVVADGNLVPGIIEKVSGSIPPGNIIVIINGKKQPGVEVKKFPGIDFLATGFDEGLLDNKRLVILATADEELKGRVITATRQTDSLLFVDGDPLHSDFHIGSIIRVKGANISVAGNGSTDALETRIRTILEAGDVVNDDRKWKRITSKFIAAFALMVLGYLVISSLPLPTFKEVIVVLKPYFDYHFLLFVLTGFVAQMIDGVLSMGYGVTSATCLMSLGVNPVSVSAAIHTSEIFTSGVSGYSHYRFGNVNMRLFRHLVIPGVIGAILGALLLVFLGEKAGSWLMPLVAVYAMFLGIKILIKAFQLPQKNKKVKRVGWLAWIGGLMDSFGGGGWGPIVTSTLIAKGRSPKYTIGSVSLTEFFVTLASATTFFVTVGIQHWNIVLGLLIGGAIAAPVAARLAGRLPRKTMMIAVGIMVIIWCVRMVIKSVF